MGRGAATTFQRDLSRSDCILIMGSNMAEAHPVGFRWPMKAKEEGATMIHADPRFTRTSAMADVYVPIRAGSDIAFLGGIINYVIENRRWFEEYVAHYTNAATIIHEDFRDTEDLNGYFAGFDSETGIYDLDENAWAYKKKENKEEQEKAIDESDPTLQHPRCVFQIVKRHFSRYTLDMVARICGCSPEEMIRVAELLCRNSGRERNGR
jgi:formate dehydrogenase major subunit